MCACGRGAHAMWLRDQLEGVSAPFLLCGPQVLRFGGKSPHMLSWQPLNIGYVLIFVFLLIFFFWHNVLLWIPAYPGIREPPASASFALKSKLHATIPNLNMSFYCTSAFPGNGSGGQRAAMFFDDLWWTDRRQEGKSKTLQGFTTIWATSHSSWMHSVRAQYPNSSMLYCVAWVKWEHPTSQSFSCKMGVSEGNCYN